MKWEIIQLLSLPKQTHCVPAPSAHGSQALKKERKEKRNRRCVMHSITCGKGQLPSVVLWWGFCTESPLHELLCQKNVCCSGVRGKGCISCTQSFGVRLTKVLWVVLFLITNCSLRVQAINSQIWKEAEGKISLFGEHHNVQFLVLRAFSKI